MVKFKSIGKAITFKFLSFTFVVYVLVTYKILDTTSREIDIPYNISVRDNSNSSV